LDPDFERFVPHFGGFFGHRDGDPARLAGEPDNGLPFAKPAGTLDHQSLWIGPFRGREPRKQERPSVAVLPPPASHG
jgi:hypothetical protein